MIEITIWIFWIKLSSKGLNVTIVHLEFDMTDCPIQWFNCGANWLKQHAICYNHWTAHLFICQDDRVNSKHSSCAVQHLGKSGIWCLHILQQLATMEIHLQFFYNHNATKIILNEYQWIIVMADDKRMSRIFFHVSKTTHPTNGTNKPHSNVCKILLINWHVITFDDEMAGYNVQLSCDRWLLLMTRVKIIHWHRLT